MRKVVLMLALGLSFLSFGQLNLVEVSAEEIDILGNKALSDRNAFADKKSFYTNEEINKYDFKNTLGFIIEFKYQDKTLAKYFIAMDKKIQDKKAYYSIRKGSLLEGLCFEAKNFSQDLLFELAKSNDWNFRTPDNDEGEFVCLSEGVHRMKSFSVFRKDARNKPSVLNHIPLPGDEKIETVLYKVMK
ncbi:MAG: hypothetical protein Q4B43_09925 [Bacteroidota bacterium]|nr:hypothetical protein [Bacteroidota bacterium]